MKLVRLYTGSDGYMLETSAVLHALFTQNIADFTALDNTMDAAFATSWLGKIDAAGSVVQHSQIKDIQVQKTELVLAKMDECREKYNEVKFFANKVFKESPGTVAEFGTDTYGKASRKQVGMIAFMDEMHKACVTYQLELTAGGMSQASIDQILTLKIELGNANTLQELYKRAKPGLTHNRVETLNACYEDTKLIIDAAMVIYYNDFTKRNMYVYNHTTGSGGSGDDGNDGTGNTTTVTNTLTDDIPVLILNTPYDPAKEYIITNNGPAEVVFYISDSPDNQTIDLPMPPNSTETVTAEMLGDIGNNLYAQMDTLSGLSASIVVEVSL